MQSEEGTLFDANAPGPAQPLLTGGVTKGFSIDSVAAWNFEDHKVMCSDCAVECSIVNCRLLAKVAGKFRCPQCSSTHTKIHRSFGAGMSASLLRIPEADRQSFFKNAKDLSQNQMADTLTAVLNKFECWEQTYEHGGTFRPLSVWARDGYDPHIIETQSLPQDIRPDRMFGMVYRVPELRVIEKGTRGRRSDTSYNVGPQKKKRKGSKQVLDGDNAGDDEQPEPDPKEEVPGDDELPKPDPDAGADQKSPSTPPTSCSSSSSDSSDSSSDSSSSSDKKKKKKKKKTKKTKKTKQSKKLDKKKKKAKQEQTRKAQEKEAQTQAAIEERHAKMEERKAKLAQEREDKDTKKKQDAAKKKVTVLHSKLEKAVQDLALIKKQH